MFNAHGLVCTLVRFTLLPFVLLAVIAVSAVAQTPPQAPSNVGSFRGRIIDADTRQPVTQEITVVVYPGGSDANRRVMDVTGEFVVSDLPLGQSRLSFREKGISFETPRYVEVTGLSTIIPVDIYLRRLADEINGVVLDEDRQPIQGSKVMLVSVKYLAGQAVYTFPSEKTTDDRGYFSFSTRVESGHPYFLLAFPPEANRPTLSGTPSLEAAWYPSRPGLLQPFVLRSGERKRVDLVLEKKQTHCVDGRLTQNGNPASLNFEIVPQIPGYLGRTGGTQGVVFRGQSDASGHFQVCGLWPGEFLIAAGMNKETPRLPRVNKETSRITPVGIASYGRAIVSIADRDVHDVMLNAQSPVSLSGEIRLDSAQTPTKTYRLSFTPLSRIAFETQPLLASVMDVVVPSPLTVSRFMVSLLPSTDYMVRLDTPGGTSDAYLKEVTCGGTVRRDSVKLGDTDCGLQIAVGTDLGKLNATIVDKDNKNDLNSSVCVSPTSAVTREEIGSTGTCSSADPGATSVSIALRPDRYFAVVMPSETGDWVEYFLTNRGQGTPIDIKARSTVQATLKSINAR
jgi:hypothetical protein